MAEVSVKVGRQVQEQDVDRARAGKGKRPETTEVEGQDWVTTMVLCPCCWAANVIDYDTERYHWYECWNCGCWYEM